MASVPSDQRKTLTKIDRMSAPPAGLGPDPEEVADAPDRPDQGPVTAELLPEVADVHVEGPIEPRRSATVEGGRQLDARDDPPRRVDEELEDVVLDRGQRHG